MQHHRFFRKHCLEGLAAEDGGECDDEDMAVFGRDAQGMSVGEGAGGGGDGGLYDDDSWLLDSPQ